MEKLPFIVKFFKRLNSEVNSDIKTVIRIIKRNNKYFNKRSQLMGIHVNADKLKIYLKMILN